MAKTRKKSKATSKTRKPVRVARKPAKVSWLAKGYPVLSSVTVLDECAQAIDWYKKVLGAKQRLRFDMPNGHVAHCELGFGDAVLMLGSPMPPQFPSKKAVTVGQILTLVAFLLDSRFLRPLAWATAGAGLYAIWDYTRAAAREKRAVAF